MGFKKIATGGLWFGSVWTGIGAFGTALVGILFLGDPATVGRIAFLVLLIGSVIGLKLVSPNDRKPAQVKEVS